MGDARQLGDELGDEGSVHGGRRGDEPAFPLVTGVGRVGLEPTAKGL